MRRTLFGTGFLALVAFVVCATWRSNAFSNAPLKWKVAIEDYESLHHVDQDSIYCAANVSAVWGSLSSMCRLERDTGKVLWRRKKIFNGDVWEYEDPICWTTNTCFAKSGTFDGKTKKTSNSRITALSLRSGGVQWEVPVSAEVSSLALGEALYCITNDGRFTTHQEKTGAIVSELDLRALAGPRASYGGIEIFGNVAIVGSHLSHDYTNPQHAKVFLLSLKANRLLAELPRGEYVDGRYVIYTGKEWQSFDLSVDEPEGVPMKMPERSFPERAVDQRGAVWAQMTSEGWQLLGADAKPFGPSFKRDERVMHIANGTLYLWDYHTLRSVDRYTGAAKWSIQIERIDYVSASFEQVLVRSRGDALHCLDARTGALRWKHHLHDEMGGPAWCEGTEVTVSEKGTLLYFAR